MPQTANVAIGKAVRTLRKRAGWSQAQLAEMADLEHRQTVSAIERGDRALKASELLALARLFRVDANELLTGQPPVEENFVLWRKGPGDGSGTDAEALFLQRCRRYAVVERLSGVEARSSLPQFAIDLQTTSFERAENLADHVRSALHLGDIPGPALRGALENTAGVKVFEELLESGSAATTHGEFGPAVLENANEPPARRTYSLAHELFHVVTWDALSALPPRERVRIHTRNEQLAEVFASALLMPRGPVLESVSRRPAETLGDLLPVAHEFNVSLPALLWRLVNLKRIDRRAVESFLDPETWWGATDHGWKPPHKLERPLPKRYVSLAFSTYTKGRMTVGKLAELMETNVGMLPLRLDAYGLDLDSDDFRAEAVRVL